MMVGVMAMEKAVMCRQSYSIWGTFLNSVGRRCASFIVIRTFFISILTYFFTNNLNIIEAYSFILPPLLLHQSQQSINPLCILFLYCYIWRLPFRQFPPMYILKITPRQSKHRIVVKGDVAPNCPRLGYTSAHRKAHISMPFACRTQHTCPCMSSK